MTYIENIFICIAAPLVVTAVCLERKYIKYFIFGFLGMGACMLSAYVNSFFAVFYFVDAFNATVEIAPVVEETIKLLPLLFYLLIFEPKANDIKTAVLIMAAGFATFENICYLIQNGAENFTFLLFRGFGTGAMHIITGAIVGIGMMYVWQRPWLKIAGTCGLLGVAISFHAIYNLMVAYGGIFRYTAYAMPIVSMILGLVISKTYTYLKSK